VPILVGLWNAVGDIERQRQRLEAIGANSVCTSFAECMALLEIRFSSARRTAHGAAEEAPAASRDVPATTT
jgi:hypothetical protein